MSEQKKRTTIHDIARELGLTGSTVSRALSDHPRISATTKALVRKKAQELNYRHNALASTLRTGKSNSIGVVIPRINRHFFANLIHGIEQVCAEAGFHLLICQSLESNEKERAVLKTLLNSRVDGILVSLSAESEQTDHLKAIANQGVPVVLVDRITHGMEHPSVTNEDFQTCYDLTSHLVRQGCHRLVHFGGPAHLESYDQRYKGFQKALEEAGLTEFQQLSPILTDEEGYRQTKQLFQQDPTPDAIVSASDYSAQGAFRALQELGIEIPGDVALSGYANEPFTTLIHPQMTSVELFPEQMGKEAAGMLLDLINHASGTEPARNRIQPVIHFRASTQKSPDGNS